MIPQVKAPQRSRQPVRGENGELGGSPADSVEIRDTAKLRKLSRLKLLNQAIWRHLGTAVGTDWCHSDVSDVRSKLRRCGAYLLLRQYVATGRVQLRTGNFCQQRGMCPCCDAARARRLVQRFEPRFDQAARDGGQHYMLTLTWPPPPETESAESERACAPPPRSGPAEVAALHRNMELGLRSVGKLWKRRKEKGTGPFRDVLGLVYSVEVARTGLNWHPHLHCVVTLPKGKRVDARELRAEWQKLTGGKQLRLDPLKGRKGFLEAFKYATKPQDVKGGKIDLAGLSWRFLAYQGLRGRRLIHAFGCYFGQDTEPNLAGPEGQDSSGDFLEWVASWCETRRTYGIQKRVEWAG